MKTLYMAVGLPASGKTTWAKAKMAEHPGCYKRVNKDDLRAMLDDGKWSRDNEKFVLAMSRALIDGALGHGKHCICDDTNLHPKHETALREIAKKRDASFEIVDFRDVPLETCLERDAHRQNYVGEAVIRRMHRDFLAVKPVPVAHDPALPDCVIVDIDGTVALMTGRSPYDYSRVSEDAPNEPVCALVRQQLLYHRKVIFVSGRKVECREVTVAWLNAEFGSTGMTVDERSLFMRADGDNRDDRIIKREIYEREIQGKYNVLFVLDDRRRVVEQWRQMGLTCLQVAEGEF